MKFNFLKKGKKNLRAIIKAHNSLIKNKKISRVNSIFIDCINSPLPVNSKSLFLQISINQYIVAYFFDHQLVSNIKLGIYNPEAEIICPLPIKWIKIIENNGIKVRKNLSQTIYFFKCLSRFMLGIITFIKIIFEVKIIKNTFNDNVDFHFHKLLPNNLAERECELEKKNIVNWFKKKYSTKINYTFSKVLSRQNYPRYCRNKILKNDIAPIETKNIFKFILVGFKSIVASFFELLSGSPQNAIMLHEIMLLYKIKLVPKKSLSKKYLFNNTSYIYRPLWTYEAQNLGSDIILYFYSTNIDSPMIDKISISHFYGYEIMNWPKYLVWNDAQKFFINKFNCSKAFIQKVGPIHFSDSIATVGTIPKKSIAVFDITPYRLVQQSKILMMYDYYNYKVTREFLEKIYQVAEKNNYYIIFKQKRDLLKLGDRRYLNFVNTYSKRKNVIKIHSEVNALNIIEKVKGVISMPFTSTDNIARDLSIPAVYFDSTKRIQRKKDAGINNKETIIYSVKQLDDWIKTI